MIVSIKDRYEIRKEMTRKRVEKIVPELMTRENIDMWIVAGGDGNIEPVMEFLIPEDALGKTVLVFCNIDGKYERFQNYRFVSEDPDALYKSLLNRDEDLFSGIHRLIKEKQPKNIALNLSETFSVLDGVSHTFYNKIYSIVKDIPIISAEAISLDLLQIRLPEELDVYEDAAEYARELIAEVLSNKFVQPGKTTTADIRWHMLKRMDENGLKHTWGPNVNMQRCGSSDMMIGGEYGEEVILPGDLLHIDFGFSYLQLNTDMQYLAYVLKDNELVAPKGLVDGFEECHRFQQIFMDTVKAGKTGNEARREILNKAKEAGMKAMVYSHPIGQSVHSVGPCIGRFGCDGDLPSGELEIKNNTCYAMEQNVQVIVPEWDNQKVYIFREEDVAVVDGNIKVIGELQNSLWLI